MNLYLNTDLNDIEGEIWIDAFSLDGYYEVSNFGRIKSVGRYVNTKGGQRWKKEIIVKQFLDKTGNLKYRFSMNGSQIDIYLPRLFYFSFNTNTNIKGRDWVVMHKNKNKTDNRIENLKYVTCSASHEVNFKKGISGHQLEEGRKVHRKFTRENSIFDENGKTVNRTCKDCMKTLPQSKFDAYGTNTCNKCKYQKWKKRQEKLKELDFDEFEKKRIARNEQIYEARRKRNSRK
ncbi:NUMOD4 domain-containing protein [Algibacter sp. PT7-4]|uniref:NUMOD4 domain-containing protein n=1 Tax=Algibacter ulvanivorans TaxID=3400999 RepID=UPI003AAE9B1E